MVGKNTCFCCCEFSKNEKPSTFITTLEECLIKNFKNMSAKDYQIPVKEAAIWTNIWRIACPDRCKAFLIPIEDMIGVLQEMEVLIPDGKSKDGKPLFKYDEGTNRAVRAYMAINPKNIQGHPEEKLLLVGTQKITRGIETVYKDILDGQVDGQLVLGDGKDSGVYDFTEPCPTVCDEDSELNGGG